MFVVDASTALEWFLENPRSAPTERSWKAARKQLLVVPAIWPLETHNALLKLTRRGILTAAEAEEFRVELRLLAKRVDAAPDQETVDRIWEIAVANMMTVYDASYIELADRLNLPIASNDAAIRAAAKTLGLHLV